MLVTPGTSAVGCVSLPCFFSTAMTASVGVGCARASAGVRDSMGLPFMAANASSTDCMSASALNFVPVCAIASAATALCGCSSRQTAMSAAAHVTTKVAALRGEPSDLLIKGIL